MRLIDADALIAKLMSSVSYKDYEWSMYADEFIEELKNAPTIEPSRPMGEWVTVKDCGQESYKCSACGFEIMAEPYDRIAETEKPNYCEVCGAYMKGGTD